MAKPIKAPIKGMPMPMGKRPAPPPFPIPHPAQMQAPQAPQAPQAAPGFASGTPDVPRNVPRSQNQGDFTPRAKTDFGDPPGFSGRPGTRIDPYSAAMTYGGDVNDRGIIGINDPRPVDPRVNAGRMLDNAQSIMGYAQGTPNVPAPGQTTTNGSWNPQEAPPPTPLSPSPLSGQNTGLRARLGISAGTPRFAEGTSDVGGPNVGAGGGQPAQGYDAQTASYSGLDQHFVAHLRAAIGLAPKEQGFAGGTDDVGFNLGGAPGITNPATVTPADRVISGQLGPFSWGQQAVANKTAAPANPGGQPGGTVPDNPNDFTTRASDQQIDSPFAGAPANPQGQPGGSLPGRPALGGGFQQAGANDPMFGSVLQALVGQPQTTTATNKQITDPNLNQTVVQLSGADPRHVDAMLNPHEYTREQFQAAVADMPWGMAKSLWAMQHYLTPQQQSAQRYIRDQNNQQAALEQTLAGSKPGTDEYAKNKKALEALQDSRTKTGSANLTGAEFPLVGNAGGN